MKSQPVEFLDFVEDDLRHAYDFYESWLIDGRNVFRKRFLETISWIEWNPEQFPKKYGDFRRAIIRKTYFAAFYVIEPQVSTVVAVLDMRQDPEDVRKRISKRKLKKR